MLGQALRDQQRELSVFRNRLLLAGLLILTAFALLVGRFTWLQVVQREYYHTLAEANRISVVPVVPNRGVIYDRNGEVLAANYSAYTLEITPSRVGNVERAIDELSRVIEIAPRDRRRFRKGVVVLALHDLEPGEAAHQQREGREDEEPGEQQPVAEDAELVLLVAQRLAEHHDEASRRRRRTAVEWSTAVVGPHRSAVSPGETK